MKLKKDILKRMYTRHILLLNFWKLKRKSKLNEVREKQHLAHRTAPIQSTANFSSKTMEVKRKWCSTFQVLKKKELPTKNSISSKTILQKWRGNPDILRWKKNKNKKTKECVTSRPTLKDEGNKMHQVGKTKDRAKIWVHTINYNSPHDFYKSYN